MIIVFFWTADEDLWDGEAIGDGVAGTTEIEEEEAKEAVGVKSFCGSNRFEGIALFDEIDILFEKK